MIMVWAVDMEMFFWICGALIVIGLPALAMLMIYASLKLVKEDVRTIQSLKDDIYNLESDYQKLEIERDSFDIQRDHALQKKAYAEERLENYSYKHISVVNSIHRGILKKHYKNDELDYISLLLKEHGGTIGDFNREDEEEIIEGFIKKYPNPSM